MDTGTIAGLVLPGLATGLGGLALVVVRSPSERTLDTLLGLTAGVMLAAAVFSLLVPALERGSLGEVLLGVTVGAAAMVALDTYLPHAHARFHEQGRAAAEELTDERRRAALLISALTIHNIPEGLAVGVAFAAGGPELGVPIADRDRRPERAGGVRRGRAAPADRHLPPARAPGRRAHGAR
jgi:zinc transporter, ZIP family